jgi:hypothetical protein
MKAFPWNQPALITEFQGFRVFLIYKSRITNTIYLYNFSGEIYISAKMKY